MSTVKWRISDYAAIGLGTLDYSPENMGSATLTVADREGIINVSFFAKTVAGDPVFGNVTVNVARQGEENEVLISVNSFDSPPAYVPVAEPVFPTRETPSDSTPVEVGVQSEPLADSATS